MTTNKLIIKITPTKHVLTLAMVSLPSLLAASWPGDEEPSATAVSFAPPRMPAVRG
jgi:hypothetical protein